MATAPHSTVLFENVNKLLTTFIPAHGPRDANHLHTSIGVKSHGTITFPDNKSNRAEFIRVAPDASVLHVKELLTRQWCNGPPSLVISVTGGAKDYNMRPKLLRAFRRGLLKVARTTGAWIITGGMNTGIMKLVGEIVQINPDRSRPIHLIGIATWGCVSGFQQLDVHGSVVHYAQPRSNIKGEAPLEPNHTEFIFVDDESVRKYGREISFRAKLEQAISSGFFASKTSTNSGAQYTSLQGTPSLRTDHSKPVPVVLLVVEGGPNTVRTVHEAVVQNNIPAVFLEGTGRCCDLFAKACRLYAENCEKMDLNEDTPNAPDPINLARRHEELKKKLREELTDELREISGDTSTPTAAKAARKPPGAPADSGKTRSVDKTDYFELVYECVHTRTNFLNVISLNSRNPVEPDIDLVILQALLNATSANDSSKTNIQRKHEQLHLALEWNRVDIARNYIMRNEHDWENIDLQDLFTLALDRNQISFVKLFLDHDFSLTVLFRKNDKLLELYMSDMKGGQRLTKVSADPLRTIYQDIIQPLIGDFFEVDAALPTVDLLPNHHRDDEEHGRSCFCCKRRYRSTPNSDRDESLRSEASVGHTGSLIDVDKELFLWSVITGRRDFALLFWSRGKNKICAALIATLIYRRRDRKDMDDSYHQSANEFEHLAVQILDKFYHANPHTCMQAIIRPIPAYGNVTWLELAVAAEAKEFIAQRAVQDVLNDIWYGHINQRVTITTVVFSTIMLWYSGFLDYQNELVKSYDETTLIDASLSKGHRLQPQMSHDKRMSTRPQDTIHMRLMNSVSEDAENEPVRFVDFGCCEKTKTSVRQYFKNIATFMRAPYVKYLYNLYFHMIFLFLFSYVVLCDLFPLYQFTTDACLPAKQQIERGRNTDDAKPITSLLNHTSSGNRDNRSIAYGMERHGRPSIAEMILVVWVFTLFCEEIRQFLAIEAQSSRNALVAYFNTFWNKLDILAIFLFFVGFTLRFLPNAECFCAARIVLSIDLSLWFIRSLDIFAAIKRLGPKLVMIGEMAHDLKFFMLMLTVFILAFGVPSYSLIYGVQEFSWHIPREIVNLAYWQIFGELNALEAFEDHYNANGYATFILLVAYMAIVSILLVNLLIAMFSNTFDRLQSDTDRIWKFQRYSLVCEYLSRPSLPPPFIFISHLWRSTLHILAKYCDSECIQSKYQELIKRTQYQKTPEEKKATIIEIAEDALGDEVYYNYLKSNRILYEDPDIDEERVQTPQENMLNKVRTLENRIQIVTNQQAHMFDYLECLMDGLRIVGGDRIRMPERRRFDPESFDDSNNHGGASKRTDRRESLIDDYRYRSNSNGDDPQGTIINFFPSRRNGPFSSAEVNASDV